MEFPARWPAAHRREIGTPKGSRALGPFRQAALAAQGPDLQEELDLCRAQFLAAPDGTPKGRSETALDRGTRPTNALIRHVRARGERTAAELKERWRTLKHVTLGPSRIGDMARAALVRNGHWK
ncbi:hypothetical protein [Streptomyces sp. NPDC002078]